MTWPSDLLRDVLEGRTSIEDASPAIRSWSRFFIHQGALELLALPDKPTRRNALKRVPARIRPHIEAEAKRIWAMR